MRTHEEAGLSQTPFEKGNLVETPETQNHRANDFLPREIDAGWAAKGEEAYKSFQRGVSRVPRFQRVDPPLH